MRSQAQTKTLPKFSFMKQGNQTDEAEILRKKIADLELEHREWLRQAAPIERPTTSAGPGMRKTLSDTDSKRLE